MKQLSRIAVLSLAVFCLFIVQGCFKKSTNRNLKSSTEPATTVNAGNTVPPKAKVKRAAPDFTVTATQLAKEFGLDKEIGVVEDYDKAANEAKKIAEKYAGKEVAISGRLYSVNTARTPMTLSLKTGNEMRGSVSGDFDEEERGGLCPLREDQKVTIQCVGGYNRIRSVTGQPDLTRCTIIEIQ